jgi:hypothetical protein
LGQHDIAWEVSSRNDNESRQFPISDFDFSSTRDFALTQTTAFDDSYSV